MYYDQLLALKDDLKRAFLAIVNNKELDKITKEQRLMEVSRQIAEVKEKMRFAKVRYNTYGARKAEAKNYKKAVKHEFLTQAKAGYSIDNIVSFIRENYFNPGVNLEKLIQALRVNGYFIYDDAKAEDSTLELSGRANRYLENEANVSLKR